MSMTKEVLRQYYKQRRSQLSHEERELGKAQIEEKFFTLLASFSNIIKIAGYVAMNHELDISNILSILSTKGYQILLPSCQNEQMVFCSTEISLKKDNVPDLIITPLIACDAFGNRLGYGKGFYDKKIGQLRQNGYEPIVVGLCYEVQFGVNLPTQPHDQSLDYIITENKVMRIGVMA